jgi:CheY-like chemotaxis protein
MNRTKILVIDDDTLFTQALEMYLESLGSYEIRVENDPRKALEVACEFQPSVVLLDVIMPWLDGGEVAAKFAAHPVLCGLPIIMLTALVTQDVSAPESVIQAGPVDILPKPIAPALLVKSIDNAVHAARRR